MCGRIAGHPGTLGGRILATSARIGHIIIVLLGLFENARSHFLRVRHKSQGQPGVLKSRWVNLLLPLCDVPGKVYT